MVKDKQKPQNLMIAAQYEHYHGPIPSSAEMARYASIDSTLPDRIMTLVEKQSTHRQKLESKHLETGHIRSLMGTICAFIIVITAIIGGTFCVISNKEVVGIATILTAMIPVVGAFVYGTVSNRRERLQKWEEIKLSGSINDNRQKPNLTS